MADYPAIQGQVDRKTVTKRGAIEILRGQLMTERASFLSHWMELGDFIMPRRPRFWITDNNKGNRRNRQIIDSTATLAARTLRSGMMSGFTSPARPWFRLTTSDPELADVAEVKDWLETVTTRMRDIFLRSNLYNVLPIIYGDIGTFGTAAMLIDEDFENVVRFYPFPIGSYMIANDDKLRVRVFYREFRMTVRQLLDMFGKKNPDGTWIWNNFSDNVKNMWMSSQMEAWVEVAHVIMPNEDYDENKLNSKFKKFKSCYYERGSSNGSVTYVNLNDTDRFLRESGYDLFPVLAPRWEINGEDVYGTSCPGMDALGDVKALQLMHKRKAQAIEKMVNPPMTGPTAMRTSKATILPGDITYVDAREGQQGFRPAHEVNPRIQELVLDIQDHQQRIRRAFYEDLFLMLANDERLQPRTAQEVMEKKEEKLLALGPVLEQLNQDMNDPLIDVTFDIMLRQGLIPEPPEQLQGTPLRVEYESIMAQAQKLLGIGGMERFAGFVQTLVTETQDLTILDKVDMDQLIEQYGEQVSIPNHVIRSDDDVDAIRKGRAQAQKAKAAQEMLVNAGKTAKDLAGADTSGQNALTDLLHQANAGNLVPQQ